MSKSTLSGMQYLPFYIRPTLQDFSHTLSSNYFYIFFPKVIKNHKEIRTQNPDFQEGYRPEHFSWHFKTNALLFFILTCCHYSLKSRFGTLVKWAEIIYIPTQLLFPTRIYILSWQTQTDGSTELLNLESPQNYSSGRVKHFQ